MPDQHLQIHSQVRLWPPTWPMGLTMLRLLLLPVFLWLILADSGGPGSGAAAGHYRRWALAVFAVMALTDKLDGYLARRLDQASKIGALLDPIADKLLIACSVILLSFKWAAPPGFAIPRLVVIAVYGKDVLVAIGALALLYAVGRVSITPRFLGKASTALQLMLVMVILLAPDLYHMSPLLTNGVVKALWWIVSLAACAACTDYVVRGVADFKRARRDKPTPQSV